MAVTITFSLPRSIIFLAVVLGASVSAAACIAVFRGTYSWRNVFEYTRVSDADQDEEASISVPSAATDEGKDERLFKTPSIGSYWDKYTSFSLFRSWAPIPQIVLTEPSGTSLPLPLPLSTRILAYIMPSSPSPKPPKVVLDRSLLRPKWMPRTKVTPPKPVTADTIKTQRKAVVNSQGGRARGRSGSFYGGAPKVASGSFLPNPSTIPTPTTVTIDRPARPSRGPEFDIPVLPAEVPEDACRMMLPTPPPSPPSTALEFGSTSCATSKHVRMSSIGKGRGLLKNRKPLGIVNVSNAASSGSKKSGERKERKWKVEGKENVVVVVGEWF